MTLTDVILILFYFWGCERAWRLMRWQTRQTTSPLTWGERWLIVSLVPLSWITWCGLILIEMGQQVKRDYYSSYNNNLDNKSDNGIESDNGE